MTIYWTGTNSEINIIRQHLRQADHFNFVEVTNVNALGDLSDAGLYLIGASVEDPIKLVYEIVKKDKLLSIIILTEPIRYKQLCKAIQFSLHIGKTTSCAPFNPDSDYSDVFKNAIVRTRQKRTFNKFKLDIHTKLSELTEESAKLENLGDVLEHAPIGAMLLSQEFLIVGANKASRQMFQQLSDSPVSLSILFPFRQFEAIKKHIDERDARLLA
ncbi:MAG TPA: hypothetical protein VFT90_01660, partial [Chryseosolibacter sp.]|nr:hypothetical protein [Chryseosolibacter sp.]